MARTRGAQPRAPGLGLTLSGICSPQRGRTDYEHLSSLRRVFESAPSMPDHHAAAPKRTKIRDRVKLKAGASTIRVAGITAVGDATIDSVTVSSKIYC